MAVAAYGSTPPPGWVPLRDPTTGIDLIPNESNGFQARAYISSDPGDKRIFVAVAGTNDGKDVASWSSAVTGWDAGAQQFKDGLDFAAKIDNIVKNNPQYAGYSISASGHSFAEGFVQMFTYTFGWDGVGYDGIGAGAIIRSTGYTQYLASQNITPVGGTNFISCNTAGVGPFGGGIVGSAGPNIEGTRQCTVTLENSTASGVFNVMSTILASNPLLGFVLGKLVTGVKLHDMDGIDQAIQNGSYEVAPDSQTVPSPGVVFPRLDPFAIDDGQGNMLSTLIDSNGNVVTDGNGTPILNLEIATGGNAKAVYHVSDNGTSLNAPNGAQALLNALTPIGNAIQTYAPPLIDALSLVKAIQSGEPLPVVASGLRLANTLNTLNGGAPNYNLSGAASVGSGILSIMSLDAALKRGDTMGAITAGAQALGAGVQAYISFSGGVAEVSNSVNNFSNTLSGTPGTYGPSVIGVLNLVNAISKGDEVGAAMSVISMTPAAPIAYAYYAFQMVRSLFGGSDAPPEAWGNASATWSGFNAVANATGAYGGLETATQTYNSVLTYLDQLVAEQQRVNPGSAIGIVANRMPSLTYRNYTGYGITDIDPLTGEQRNPGVLYDLTGRPYNAPAGSVQASQSLSERMIRVALERGAIAPMWEVETAALQTQAGDPMAGLTEEERAGRAGLLAPSPAAGATTQTFRPVALDLNGDGVQTTGAARTVAFNVDDSGYLKNTAWLNNSDGFLFLDRNLNGQIDGGKELFSNSTVALSGRGLNGMRWIDSNYDGSLSALDPVWNELKVWQDANGNGAADAGETRTLAQLGITSLNYAMGTFERNGQVSELSSPDLVADTEGTITYTVPEGIIVQTSNGQISLLATRIDDRSAIQANRDGVTSYEDTELIISAADLLANDTLAGLSGSNLSITGVSGFTHGSGFLDGNGFVHYTPDANYFGAAQFDYSIKAVTGQTATASVDITLQNVNDAPTVTLDQHLRPIYGYVGSFRWRDGDRMLTGLGVPHYEPYYGYDAWTDTYGAHNTIVKWEDTDGPNKATVIVSDIDDPTGSLTFDVSAQAQKGEGTVDASGNIGYVNWSGPNTPGTEPDGQRYRGRDSYVDTYSTQADPFTVRVTDPQGASATIQVDTVHTGAYNPNLGSGGGGKPISIDLDGNGFQFTNVDDSNVFFDINNDGWKHRMAWVAPGDGLLAFDADGNGLIDNGSEISFAGYQPDAQTDLEGLAAFDTNNDGFFSALDAQWGKFGVWQDADQDGITDAGEFKTLDELGIASVNLASNGQFQVINGQTVHGIGQVTKADGSTLNMADVTLQYSDEVLVHNADGTTTVAVKPPFAPLETITGTPGKDLLLGNNGNTIIEALEGDDVVFSDIGNDVIDAGAGNDIVYAGGGNDLVIGAEGDDVVFAGLGNDVVLGGDGHDALFGEGGNDVIFGGDGNDLVAGGDGNNVLSGDAGDDQVYGGTGNDALFGGAGNDELAGMEGYDRLDGGDGNDLLDGGAQDDALFGGAGDDILIGGAGNDSLDGGSGNDTYMFGRGAGQDTISDYDAAAGNVDIVRLGAGISAADVKITRDVDNLYISINGTTDKLTLANWFAGEANRIEQLVFADGVTWDVSEHAALLSIPTEGDDFLVGTAGDDFIEAFGGNDTLAGLAGNDYLQGGSGNDTYLFGRGAGQDYVYEYDTAAGNIDTIKVAADVNPADVKVTRDADNLYLSIKGTTDKITVLDWFASDAGKVERVEFADGTVWDVAALATKAADSTLTADGGSSTILGTPGNDTMVGNALNNLLDGGVGGDTMIGGAGDDTYVVDNAGDLVIENLNEGNDSVHAGISYTLTNNVENLTLTGSANLHGTGNALDNVITGNNGNNLLDGGYGADTLSGGRGDDTYVVDSTGDIVIENPNAGNDTVLSSIGYKLTANVENLVLTGSGNIGGTGNALNNVITGNAGNNRIDGGAGADTMQGGAGNDVYLVDDAGDVVVEEANAGFDTVQVGFDYTLGDNVESLLLTGTGNINGTGNALSNMLTGNAGNNVLDGGLGADAMLGGAGDDTYIVDNAGDRILEDEGAGIDTVRSSVTYTLAAEIENMVLTGSLDINGTGNELDNVITGNSGNNRIDGGLGADTMAGGAGNDTYVVDDAGDVVVEEASAGFDTVEVGFDYTLGGNVEGLTLTGTGNFNGTGNALDNVLSGNAGNNVLDGGLGADAMAGGAGDDTYIVDNVADIVAENPGEGTDTVLASVSYGLSDNVENLVLTGADSIDGTGNALDNLMIGNDAANVLLGLDGNDTLIANGGNDLLDGGAGADIMQGGSGDDTYVVESSGDLVTEAADSGIDTVESSITYTLTDNVENLILTGADAINGTGNELDNLIVGNDAANILSGLGGNDTLIANGGDDRLDGGLGADTMLGGSGDDTYVVESSGDLVIEAINSGIDTAESGITYTLTDNVENLILTGTDAINGTGNGLDNIIIGNDAANVLSGLDGNDTLIANGGNDWLDGGLGADTMSGGLGDDTYVVDNIGDLVSEGLDSGIDTVLSGISYTLTDNVENLVLTNTDAIDGTGNALDNLMIGNDAANVLLGLDGNDTLIANGGNDLLDGGAGADTMQGGAGDDTYVVDNAFDIVMENLNEGIDTILASVSYGLSANVENLTLTGSADIDGTGNELDNIITGNDGANILSGLDGNDTLLANGGNDRLDGGTGSDVMQGGAGDDTYVVESDGDLVIEAAGSGIDTVESGITYTLTDNVENLILTGTDAISGTGNMLDNLIVGNDAANTLYGLDGNDTLIANGGNDLLDGGSGADRMSGGAGDDTYVVDNVGDLVVEDMGAGKDQVFSSISYALTENVENLTLTGTAAIDGTGNALDNVIVGNAANNVLDGAAGADLLIGGAGDDSYIVDNAADVVVENPGEGTDIVFSSVSYGLSANVENLTLTGTADIDGFGNELDNILTGNEGNNRLFGYAGSDTLLGNGGNDLLDGGLGADTMHGGAGDDTYVVDNIGDLVSEDFNAGIDHVLSSITYTLTDNVENLTLTGTENINGTGNELDNVLIGNSGNNILIGLGGNDFLDGGTGADVMIGGTGDDTYVVDSTGDRVVEAGDDDHDDGDHGDDDHDDDDEKSVSSEYPAGGIDTVRSSITYTLGKYVENLVLTGSEAINGTGNDLDNILIGNAAANVLRGKDGNDTLIGNGGADTLIGGEGDDTYYVIDTQSRLIEERKEGIDTVVSSVSYILKDNFENLTLTGTQSLYAIGNELDNVLTGNEGNNILSGGEGNDTLDGGQGIDTLIGGEGDDTYVVDNSGDIIIEGRKGGMDTVRSTVSYTLTDNVENLTLAGTDDINGAGNALDNTIVGNGGANWLSGLDGNDLLQGNAANDILQGGSGNDILRDNGGNNLLDGGEGADNLTGNAGNELFAGGAGNDVIRTGNGADIIVFNRGDGRDTVYGGVGTDNTLSLGGNIRYKDIALSKVDGDLVLEMDDGDQITFKNWYETDANYKSVLNLQVVTEAMEGFDAASSDPLLNQPVQQFDFTAIVNAFDLARGNKSGEGAFRHWSAMNALLDAHLAASDSAAIGGDLAYQYGRNGSLAGIGLAAAQETIGAAQFGVQAQAIRQPALGAEVVRLG
jgi:Ca2+-binding RTX toxin-like protein